MRKSYKWLGKAYSSSLRGLGWALAGAGNVSRNLLDTSAGYIDNNPEASALLTVGAVGAAGAAALTNKLNNDNNGTNINIVQQPTMPQPPVYTRGQFGNRLRAVAEFASYPYGKRQGRLNESDISHIDTVLQEPAADQKKQYMAQQEEYYVRDTIRRLGIDSNASTYMELLGDPNISNDQRFIVKKDAVSLKKDADNAITGQRNTYYKQASAADRERVNRKAAGRNASLGLDRYYKPEIADKYTPARIKELRESDPAFRRYARTNAEVLAEAISTLQDPEIKELRNHINEYKKLSKKSNMLPEEQVRLDFLRDKIHEANQPIKTSINGDTILTSPAERLKHTLNEVSTLVGQSAPAEVSYTGYRKNTSNRAYQPVEKTTVYNTAPKLKGIGSVYDKVSTVLDEVATHKQTNPPVISIPKQAAKKTKQPQQPKKTEAEKFYEERYDQELKQRQKAAATEKANKSTPIEPMKPVNRLLLNKRALALGGGALALGGAGLIAKSVLDKQNVEKKNDEKLRLEQSLREKGFL